MKQKTFRGLRLLYHKDIVEYICNLEKGKSGTFSNAQKKLSATADLNLNVREYQVALKMDYFKNRNSIDVGTYLKKSLFTFNEGEFILRKLFFHHAGATVDGGLLEMCTKNFNKKSRQYFRLVIPVNKDHNFYDYLQTSAYWTDYGYTCSNYVQAEISGDLIEAYYFHDDKKERYFYAIESNSKMDYEQFANKAYAIKNAIGYMTGKMIGNYGYYFSYTKKDMRHYNDVLFVSLRKTMSSIYTPINARVHAYKDSMSKHLADKIYKAKTLRTLSFKELSLLSEKLYQSEDLTGIIMLIAETNSASLLFRPGGYAIALETLAPLILATYKITEPPLVEKKIAAKLVNGLKNVVNDFNAEMSAEAILTVNKKIDNIAQKTNRAKLEGPFERLGIELLPQDKIILNSRNYFLHGTVPDLLKLKNNRTSETKNREMQYAALRLYTLLNMLLLKWVGYDNYILNHVTLQEHYCKMKHNEPVYRHTAKNFQNLFTSKAIPKV